MTAAGLVKELAGERQLPLFRNCTYCGRPCYGHACAAHRDLTLIEAHDLSRSAHDEIGATQTEATP